MTWDESKRKKCLLGFLVADIVLLVVFVVTCIPFSKKASAQSSKSALLNVNKVPDVSRIMMQASDESGEKQWIELSKSGPFWTGRDSSTNTSWPADNQNIANLLSVCSQIINIRTAASTGEAWSSFGLDGESSFTLGFYDANGGCVSEIIFGETDYLSSRIAFRTGSGDKVYQMDLSVSSYLTLSTSFWADPFVYPQALTGYTRMKSESLLRHGALVDFNANGRQPDYTFRKDFENGSSARFLIYKSDMQSESLYNIVPFFIAGPSADADEKKAVESFNYAYTMSQWTLEKFSEEVVQQ